MLELNHLARVTPGGAGATYTSGDVAFDNSATTFTISDGGPRVINISVAVTTAQTFILRINSADLLFNDGVPLGALRLYNFTFLANGKDTFSFRFGGATTINYFQVAVSRS